MLILIIHQRNTSHQGTEPKPFSPRSTLESMAHEDCISDFPVPRDQLRVAMWTFKSDFHVDSVSKAKELFPCCKDSWEVLWLKQVERIICNSHFPLSPLGAGNGLWLPPGEQNLLLKEKIKQQQQNPALPRILTTFITIPLFHLVSCVCN